MKRFVVGLLLAFSFANFAQAQTPPVQSAPAKPQKSAAPKTGGGTRIVITRADAFLYFGQAAQVEVRGVKVVDLWKGQTYSAPVKPGPITITAKAFLSPGQYTVSFNAQPGRTYKFLLSPRGENYMANAIGGFGLAGMVVAHIEGKGPFKLEPMK